MNEAVSPFEEPWPDDEMQLVVDAVRSAVAAPRPQLSTDSRNGTDGPFAASNGDGGPVENSLAEAGRRWALAHQSASLMRSRLDEVKPRWMPNSTPGRRPIACRLPAGVAHPHRRGYRDIPEPVGRSRPDRPAHRGREPSGPRRHAQPSHVRRSSHRFRTGGRRGRPRRLEADQRFAGSRRGRPDPHLAGRRHRRRASDDRHRVPDRRRRVRPGAAGDRAQRGRAPHAPDLRRRYPGVHLGSRRPRCRASTTRRAPRRRRRRPLSPPRAWIGRWPGRLASAWPEPERWQAEPARWWICGVPMGRSEPGSRDGSASGWPPDSSPSAEPWPAC